MNVPIRQKNKFVKNIFRAIYNDYEIQCDGRVNIEIHESRKSIGKNIYGYTVESLIGQLVHVSFIPMFWNDEKFAQLLYSNRFLSIGDSMLPNENNHLCIYYGDQLILELCPAFVVKMPSMYLTANTFRLGQIEFLGIITLNSEKITPHHNIRQSLPIFKGSFSCNWGKETPWDRFCPNYGIDIEFETRIEPIWSMEEEKPILFLFQGIDVKAILKLCTVPALDVLQKKCDQLNVKIYSQSLSLSMIFPKMQFSDLKRINFLNKQESETHLILRNESDVQTLKENSIFEMNFNTKS